MILHNPIGLIELGTTNIKCLIFNVKDDNTTEIVSTSVFKSEGIHNGVVVNLSKASNTIRLCISEAEKKSRIIFKKN